MLKQKFPQAKAIALVIAVSILAGLPAEGAPVSVASIKADDLVEYSKQPEKIQALIDYVLGLTQKNLGYQYGSNTPSRGGMDCSGTIQHALIGVGVSVPRSSYTQYQWAVKEGVLKMVSGVHSVEDPALKDLKPGDLLFWTGTYSTKDRNPPISHVMIYLGTLKSDGKQVMFGASSGRRYRGKKIHGVSVFDFKVPSAESKSRFVAFGSVPGLR